MQTIDLDWFDSILAYTASMCLNELGKSMTDPVPIKGKEFILTHGYKDFEGGSLLHNSTAISSCTLRPHHNGIGRLMPRAV